MKKTCHEFLPTNRNVVCLIANEATVFDRHREQTNLKKGLSHNIIAESFAYTDCHECEFSRRVLFVYCSKGSEFESMKEKRKVGQLGSDMRSRRIKMCHDSDCHADLRAPRCKRISPSRLLSSLSFNANPQRRPRTFMLVTKRP